MLNRLWEKYRTFIVYMVFGLMATLLETFMYWLFYEVIGLSNMVSTVIAIFITITFAFFTNKIFVYRSRAWGFSTVIRELLSFYWFRALTGLFNMGFMYVTVDVLAWWPVGMKAIAAVLVGIMNYLLGKLVIFRRAR
ncbi:MAG: GtrA family protein [Spirochaetales bacterium]|nr:GtrA family protein [Spirochaetales bacterium]